MFRLILIVFLFTVSLCSFAKRNTATAYPEDHTPICVEALNCCQNVSQCNFPYSASSHALRGFWEQNFTDVLRVSGKETSLPGEKACFFQNAIFEKSINNSYSHLQLCKKSLERALATPFLPNCRRARRAGHKLRSKVIELGSKVFAQSCSETKKQASPVCKKMLSCCNDSKKCDFKLSKEEIENGLEDFLSENKELFTTQEEKKCRKDIISSEGVKSNYKSYAYCERAMMSHLPCEDLSFKIKIKEEKRMLFSYVRGEATSVILSCNRKNSSNKREMETREANGETLETKKDTVADTETDTETDTEKNADELNPQPTQACTTAHKTATLCCNYPSAENCKDNSYFTKKSSFTEKASSILGMATSTFSQLATDPRTSAGACAANALSSVVSYKKSDNFIEVCKKRVVDCTNTCVGDGTKITNKKNECITAKAIARRTLNAQKDENKRIAWSSVQCVNKLTDNSFKLPTFEAPKSKLGPSVIKDALPIDDVGKSQTPKATYSEDDEDTPFQKLQASPSGIDKGSSQGAGGGGLNAKQVNPIGEDKENSSGEPNSGLNTNISYGFHSSRGGRSFFPQSKKQDKERQFAHGNTASGPNLNRFLPHSRHSSLRKRLPASVLGQHNDIFQKLSIRFLMECNKGHLFDCKK